MHRFLPLALVVAAALCGAPPSLAVTFLTEENPPFNYTEDGKVTGLVTELATQMARRANQPYAIEVLPWSRAYTRAQAERDTCLFAIARLDSRERLFRWIGPVASNVWGLYGRSDFPVTPRSLPEVRHLRIGGVVNDAKVEYLREQGHTNFRLAADDRQNPPRLFLAPGDPDRIDLWVTGYYAAHDVARAAQATEVKLVLVVREIPLYVACSPQTSAGVVSGLGDALAQMRAEGVPEQLGAAYARKFAR